jgi:hypothetical protein
MIRKDTTDTYKGTIQLKYNKQDREGETKFKPTAGKIQLTKCKL